jgi:hypothetical protein
MSNRAWHPYAPDQEFGVGIAADQEFLDRLIGELDTVRRVRPRPANKAPVAEPRPIHRMPSTGWTPLIVRGGVNLDGPVTTATALEAAPDMGRCDD